ncbi:MAG: hypothetical protein ACRCYV_06165 [Aeromonas sp.]
MFAQLGINLSSEALTLLVGVSLSSEAQAILAGVSLSSELQAILEQSEACAVIIAAKRTSGLKMPLVTAVAARVNHLPTQATLATFVDVASVGTITAEDICAGIHLANTARQADLADAELACMDQEYAAFMAANEAELDEICAIKTRYGDAFDICSVDLCSTQMYLLQNLQWESVYADEMAKTYAEALAQINSAPPQT